MAQKQQYTTKTDKCKINTCVSVNHSAVCVHIFAKMNKLQLINK